MSHWPARKARLVLAALLRIGWSIKRQAGTSQRILSRPDWPDYVFAFHDGKEIWSSHARPNRTPNRPDTKRSLTTRRTSFWSTTARTLAAAQKSRSATQNKIMVLLPPFFLDTEGAKGRVNYPPSLSSAFPGEA
jgi:predicted RNA binding protein YcfA (HicA-like mRNA interferase family)